jgi:hypothetical protein
MAASSGHNKVGLGGEVALRMPDVSRVWANDLVNARLLNHMG